ncbi:MAG: F0F1 ATP synthase subunit B' [Rhodospirillaceae bacterium]|nr:F0F1 ATP synthase subunit B' [Rhodospirillaceae bacterium]
MGNVLKYKLKAAFSAVVLLLAAPPAHAAGLPQLDVEKFPPQLIWLVITFTALYLLMSKIALPRISQVLEERQHRIEDSLKKAETLKGEAEAAREAYESALTNARAEAHTVMLETHNRITADAASRQADLSARLESEIKAAEAGIGEAKDLAMGSLAEVAADVVMAMTEKLTGDAISEKDIAGAIDAAMEGRS